MHHLIPAELLDVAKVFEMGAKKYAAWDWLNNPLDHRKNADSLFHHLAKYYVDPNHKDEESELHDLLHIICRATMAYTLLKRGLSNVKD